MTAPLVRPLSSRVWTLGNPDAPDLALNAVDGDGVEWIIKDPVGWYQSPAVNLGLQPKPLHGSWYGRGAYLSRVVELEGAFRVCRGGQDSLDDIAERLIGLLDPGTDTTLAVSERVPKQLTVRPSSEVVVLPVPGHRRVRTFSLVLTAADPFKYAAGAAGLTEVPLTLLNPAAAASGLTHPAEHPLAHGAYTGDAGGRALVTNPGQLEADTVLRIVGPTPAGVAVSNATTGARFELSRALGVGEVVVADSALGTVLLSGAANSRIRGPRSTLWGLARGVNDLRFTADTYEPLARAYVAYRPRWK